MDFPASPGKTCCYVDVCAMTVTMRDGWLPGLALLAWLCGYRELT